MNRSYTILFFLFVSAQSQNPSNYFELIEGSKFEKKLGRWIRNTVWFTNSFSMLIHSVCALEFSDNARTCTHVHVHIHTDMHVHAPVHTHALTHAKHASTGARKRASTHAASIYTGATP